MAAQIYIETQTPIHMEPKNSTNADFWISSLSPFGSFALPVSFPPSFILIEGQMHPSISHGSVFSSLGGRPRGKERTTKKYTCVTSWHTHKSDSYVYTNIRRASIWRCFPRQKMWSAHKHLHPAPEQNCAAFGACSLQAPAVGIKCSTYASWLSTSVRLYLGSNHVQTPSIQIWVTSRINVRHVTYQRESSQCHTYPQVMSLTCDGVIPNLKKRSQITRMASSHTYMKHVPVPSIPTRVMSHTSSSHITLVWLRNAKTKNKSNHMWGIEAHTMSHIWSTLQRHQYQHESCHILTWAKSHTSTRHDTLVWLRNATHKNKSNHTYNLEPHACEALPPHVTITYWQSPTWVMLVSHISTRGTLLSCDWVMLNLKTNHVKYVASSHTTFETFDMICSYGWHHSITCE